VGRRFRWVLWGFAAIVVLAIAAAAALPRLVDAPRVQSYIASSVSQTLGRPVKFEAVSVAVLPWPAVTVHQLEVADDPRFGTAPFLRLDRAAFRLRLRPLLSGRAEFGEIVLRSPEVVLLQGPGGQWNVASLGASREPAAPSRAPRGGGGAGGGAALGSRIRVTDGIVRYEDRGKGGGRYRLDKVDLLVKGGQHPLAFEGSANLVPGDAKLEIADGTVAPAPGRPLFDAPVGGRITVKGTNLGHVAVPALGPATSLDGAFEGALTLSGHVGNPRAAGRVEITPLRIHRVEPQCPEPRRRTLGLTGLTLEATWSGGTLVGKPVTTGLGKGTVSTTLTASLDGGLRVELRDLAVSAVPVEKVLVDFLCHGYAVSGPLELTGALAFGAADPVGSLTGEGRLRVGPGQLVGPQALRLAAGVVRAGGAVSALLGGQVPADLGASPLAYESIVGTYQIDRGRLTTRDLLFTSRDFRLAVAGEYDLGSGRLNLDVTVNPGRNALRARVTGTAASPSIRVHPSGLAGPLDPGRAERGLQDLLKRFR
jgi:hypothetical protein